MNGVFNKIEFYVDNKEYYITFIYLILYNIVKKARLKV